MRLLCNSSADGRRMTAWWLWRSAWWSEGGKPFAASTRAWTHSRKYTRKGLAKTEILWPHLTPRGRARSLTLLIPPAYSHLGGRRRWCFILNESNTQHNDCFRTVGNCSRPKSSKVDVKHQREEAFHGSAENMNTIPSVMSLLAYNMFFLTHFLLVCFFHLTRKNENVGSSSAALYPATHPAGPQQVSPPPLRHEKSHA